MIPLIVRWTATPGRTSPTNSGPPSLYPEAWDVGYVKPLAFFKQVSQQIGAVPFVWLLPFDASPSDLRRLRSDLDVNWT